MEKKYIIGGLAIVGAIAIIAYLNKPKKNSEGFFGADGNERPMQLKCKRPDGSYYLQPAGYTDCIYGNDKEVGYDRPRIRKNLEVMDNSTRS